MPATIPNKVQQQLLKRGYGMFIHFGMNTFLEQEWSDGVASPECYAPTDLDPEQWVRTARDAGFRYVLLITKHHDGFCLWPSKYTDYSVASSPVKTDVVDAVSKACRRYGLQFAIYYSLWDRHEPSYKSDNFNDYIDFMENQLTELLSNYGDVYELWLDGGWDRGNAADWQIARIYDTVKRLQPDCAVGVNHTLSRESNTTTFDWGNLVEPDICIEDNKYFMRYFPSDFRLWDPKIASINDHKQYLHNGESYYLPFEHTICINKSYNWFQKKDPQEVRDLDELEELFYLSTANDNTLVINIAPDRTGRIREHEANAAITLAHRLGIRPGKPLPSQPRSILTGQHVTATSCWGKGYEPACATDGGLQTRWAATENKAQLVIDLPAGKSFKKLSIFEYLEDVESPDGGVTRLRKNRITHYTIDIMRDEVWETIYTSREPMGDCKVIHFPRPYSGTHLRLNILDAINPPSIYEINAY